MILVRLVDEFVDLWKPVEATKIDDKTYIISDATEDNNIEEWEFHFGDTVLVMPVLFDKEIKLTAIGKFKNTKKNLI